MSSKINFLLILLFSIFTTLIISCNEQDSSENTYWVNSFKTNCTGVAPTSCLLIQTGDTIKEHGWKNFQGNIEGFDFEPGYIYRIVVQEKQLPQSEVAADASTIKYTLIKILEKEADLRLRLNDIWILQEVYGEDITNYSVSKALENKAPYIEINIAKNLVLGFDGCNKLQGLMTTVNDKDLTFANFLSTRMMCQEMEIPTNFVSALSLIRHYEISNSHLYFKNKNNKTILTFKKGD